MSDRPILWKYSNDKWQESSGVMVSESPLALFVNGVEVAVIMRLPGLESELALGYCYDEGLLIDADAIENISFRSGDPDEVELMVAAHGLRQSAMPEVPRFVMAVAGVAQTGDLAPIDRATRVGPEWLLTLPGRLDQAQEQRRKTGGTHAAGLFSVSGPWQVICEDIGRHNAVDKCVGSVLRGRGRLEDMVLLCTGRLSYEMVAKVVRARIPVICTLAVPTALAVSLAQRYGVTLISRLTEKGFRVHSYPERIMT